MLAVTLWVRVGVAVLEGVPVGVMVADGVAVEVGVLVGVAVLVGVGGMYPAHMLRFQLLEMVGVPQGSGKSGPYPNAHTCN